MKNGKIAIALIGAGRAGMIHAANFRGSIPGAVLCAVADPAEETVKSAARELGLDRYFTDYRALLQDTEIDAVLIATPTKYHCEIAVACADAAAVR